MEQGQATDLSDSIRSRVLASNLPRDVRTGVYTGADGGLVYCGCCAKPIVKSDGRRDVESGIGDGVHGIVPMHWVCFRIWRDVVDVLYLLDGAAGVGHVPAERLVPAPAPAPVPAI
jgi:hypothetical protein